MLLQVSCLVFLVCGCWGKPQNGDFNLNPTNGGTEVQKPSNCECVPFYLCKNDTIITDGRGLLDIRQDKGRSECNNYMEICCKLENRVTDPIVPVTPPKSRGQGCGYRNNNGIAFTIEGARDGEAEFSEFPWVVAILTGATNPQTQQRELVYECGGSLIHPKIVLTAAHCVTGRKIGKRITVRAGEWDTRNLLEPLPHQEEDVESVIVHKEYRPGALYNDFALLVLKNPFKIAGNVDVICLPPKDTISTSTKCFASGWGKTEFNKPASYQTILKKIDVPVVPNYDCQLALQKTRLGSEFELHRSFICAGGEAGKDTCKGDGGGPLICPIPGDDKRYYQMGIVAWGIDCGTAGVPGVYANVASVRDWIDEEMQYQRLDEKSYTA